MSSVCFDRAVIVSYSLGKLNRQQVQLNKEQLQAIRHVYEGKEVFFHDGSLLDLGRAFAKRHCRLFVIIVDMSIATLKLQL